jgi:hypothetical protein
MKEKHTAINKKFDASFPKDVLLRWAEMISRWEQDKTAPNPYTHTEKGAVYYYSIFRLDTYSLSAGNMAELRRKLAEAEAQEAQHGDVPHEVPASAFVRSGLEIEEQQ